MEDQIQIASQIARSWLNQVRLDELSHKMLEDPWVFEKSLLLDHDSWSDYGICIESDEQACEEAAHMLWRYVSTRSHDYLEIPVWIQQFVREENHER